MKTKMVATDANTVSNNTNEEKVMKTKVIRRTKVMVSKIKELRALLREKASKTKDLPQALMLKEKDCQNTGWYGVKSQDLSSEFFSFAEQIEAKAEIYGLDADGNITNNGYSIVSESPRKHTDRYLLQEAGERYKGKEELSKEVALLFAEQCLDNEEDCTGYNRFSGEAEVSLHIEKSFLADDGRLVWFKLTERDLDLGETHKIMGSKRNEDGSVELFEYRKAAVIPVSIEEIFVKTQSGEEFLNTHLVQEIAESLFYCTQYSFDPITLGEGYRAVLSHPEMYRAVGFSGTKRSQVVEVEDGIVALAPSNIYVADRNSSADRDFRLANAEIMYGRSADMISRHAEDVQVNYRARLQEKAEHYSVEREGARAKAAVAAHNEKMNEIIARFPNVEKTIKMLNSLHASGAKRELKTYVSTLESEELEAMLDFARATKSDALRLAMEKNDFSSPYYLVSNSVKKNRKAERVLKKDLVDEAIKDIIELINTDAEAAMNVINENKELAPQILQAARDGVRITNKAMYKAVQALATKVA